MNFSLFLNEQSLSNANILLLFYKQVHKINKNKNILVNHALRTHFNFLDLQKTWWFKTYKCNSNNYIFYLLFCVPYVCILLDLITQSVFTYVTFAYSYMCSATAIILINWFNVEVTFITGCILQCIYTSTKPTFIATTFHVILFNIGDYLLYSLMQNQYPLARELLAGPYTPSIISLL